MEFPTLQDCLILYLPVPTLIREFVLRITALAQTGKINVIQETAVWETVIANLNDNRKAS